MGLVIHHRMKDGEKKYRLWSTVVDEYVTGELTEEEVAEVVMKDALERTKFTVELEMPRRFKMAHAKGTSSYVESAMPVDGPWKIWPPP